MTYITYPQAEVLLKAYPKLKSYLKNLQIELERLYHEGQNGSIDPDDILYSLAIGNRIMSDMPHAMPSPGDKMTNIVFAKDHIITDEIKGLMQAINTMGEVVEKTTSALTCLTAQERQIITLKYFEDMPWKDILRETDNCIGILQGKRIRRAAVEKILPLLRIKPEQLEFCIERMRENA